MRWIRSAVALATIMTASAVAHAADFRMFVLIDASGSMTTSAAGGTRFDAAKQAALDDIGAVSDALAPTDTLLVAVYTFHCLDFLCAPGEQVLDRKSGAADGLAAFVSKNSAIITIGNLTVANDVAGSTPLAGATCSAVDILTGLFPTSTKILSVSSDGEENATTSGPCQNVGPFYTGSPPYPTDSWQFKTINHFSGSGVIPHIWLFELSFSFRAPMTPDPERILTAEARLRAVTPSAISGLTPLEEFFTILARANGGTLNVVFDDQQLPVPGDLNGDRCVDRTDAILVARQFGPLVLPADGRHDLNFDLTVDFTDYRVQVSRITPTCGPDPFVSRAPLVCKNGGQVVIDGQAIEDGGTTIDARGSCEVVIKNSLIVSGQNAITIVGSAKITADNSIIVGQSAVVVQHGGGVISAGNTIFHGKIDFQGSLQLVDRGGNVFE